MQRSCFLMKICFFFFFAFTGRNWFWEQEKLKTDGHSINRWRLNGSYIADREWEFSGRMEYLFGMGWNILYKDDRIVEVNRCICWLCSNYQYSISLVIVIIWRLFWFGWRDYCYFCHGIGLSNVPRTSTTSRSVWRYIRHLQRHVFFFDIIISE